MTQAEIQFENLQSRIQLSWYRGSPYKTIGNVLYWLYVYGCLSLAEMAIIDENKVWAGLSQKNLIATFRWDDSLCMPIFDFVKPEYDNLADRQYLYLSRITNKITAERMFLNKLGKKCNLNTKIWVKLTEYGHSIVAEYRRKIGMSYERILYENDVGYMSFELWSFINVFGPYMNNGAENVCENNMIYFEEEKS
jgi:hypothetical protein